MKKTLILLLSLILLLGMAIPAISQPPAIPPPFTIDNDPQGDIDGDGHMDFILTITNIKSGVTMVIVYDDHDDTLFLSSGDDIVSVTNPSGMTLPF